MQVIFTEALIIDRDHTFCKGNLVASIVVAILSPIFGFLHDVMAFRMSSVIASACLAAACFFMDDFTTYSSARKFAYILGIHAMISWQTININTAVSRLFGLYCSGSTFSHIKSAEIFAALTFVPLVITYDCFNMSKTGKDGILECNDLATIGVTALLGISGCLSMLVNPTPIVNEPSDVMEKPDETTVFENKNPYVQF